MTNQITVVNLPPTPHTVVVVPSPEISVVPAGYGLQGVPGPTGPAGAAVIQYPAALAVSGHVAVFLDEQGRCSPADCRTPIHHAVAGLTAHAAIEADLVEILDRGPLEHLGWTFTPGLPVFLGLAGAITQVLPPSAVFSKVLGVAVTPTRITLDFQPAIFI